ncbi:MAG: IPTL-CTERM sorting domain-containing protein [Planctomycetota bacterium]
MRNFEVRTIVSWLTSVLVGMSIFGGAASAQVESTGFEAIDGWVAGYSICGPEFAATCSYPITNACVPNDHAASQNCCEGDPNENTGWFMADDSQHCHEPHIDTIHPSSGLQHLRFQDDPEVYGPVIANTPSLPSQPIARTVVSFEIAGSDTGSSGLEWTGWLDGSPNILIAREIFLDTGGVYHNYTLDLDPGRNVLRRCYDGQLISAESLPALEDSASWHHSKFRTRSAGGIWDIDDYSVVRGGPGPLCAVRGTDCRPGACAALVAVEVNGEPIPPTRDVHVRPGDRIETHVRFSGWDSLVNGVRVYQAALDLRAGSVMGASGTVLPVGWDAPLEPVGCATASDCPPAYAICMAFAFGGICVGPNHDPEDGVYIDVSRPDFILSGLAGFFVVNTNSLASIRYAGIAEERVGMLDQGVPRYAGTLMLDASEDACGTFHFKFDDYEGNTLLADPSPAPLVLYPTHSSLLVHVCEDDGLFCNGLESCESGSCVVTPPPNCDDGNDCTVDSCNEATRSCDDMAVCGACCDAWIGECHDAVPQADCDCPSCAWTGGRDCADVACKAEFVAIPTVSQWGLVVLTLLLLTGAKIGFARRSVNSSTKPVG